MKLTLLEIVQDIMNDLDGDNVNSVNDTVESQQVAQIVKTCYLEIMANRNWPHMGTPFNLNAVGSVSYPTSFNLPENIKEMQWFKYNCRGTTDTRDKYRDIRYMQPKDFVDSLQNRESSASNVQVVNISGLRLFIRNDKAPEYWTSFDDSTVICDAYDSSVDSVLQTGKSNCWGIKYPEWSGLDDSIPDLPVEAFPALLEEAKSTAFYVLRQVANEKAEQKAGRQQRWLSRKGWRTSGGVKYPDYGRKKAFSGYEKNPLLDKG